MYKRMKFSHVFIIVQEIKNEWFQCLHQNWPWSHAIPKKKNVQEIISVEIQWRRSQPKDALKSRN